jgi:hypothetical protein
MAIVHDAWLFDPRGFAKAIAGYAKSVADDPRDGYQTLRAATVSALDQGRVEYLAERYGGWDTRSLLLELPDQHGTDSGPIAFCFTLLLYAHLANKNVPSLSLGLHTLWRSGQAVLDRLGWDFADRELLVKGHDFAVFVEQYLATPDLTPGQVSEIRRIWTHVRPHSTAAHVGWLDLKDVGTLLRKLKDGEGKFSSLMPPQVRLPAEELDAFRRAQTMLQAAITKDHALCLILSG